MRLTRLIYFICAVALAITGSIAHSQATVVENESAVLYVDAQSGSDSNPGSAGAPLKTIQAAVNNANANTQKSIGTKIIVNAGVYRETVKIDPVGGPKAAPLTIEAATNGNAIISASDVLSGWAPDSEHSGAYVTNWRPVEDTCGLPGGWPSMQEIALHTEMVFVNGVSMAQVLAYTDLKPGTFYVDTADGTLHVFPPSGTDPSNATIEAASRAKTISVVGRSNLVLRGLVFEHAASCVNTGGATVTSSNNVLIDAIQANWNNWGGVAVSGSSNITVQNSIASYNGGVGLQGTQDQAILYTNNETDYNNWRGAQGAFYDWAMGGMKLFQMRTTTVQDHFSYNNQAQGLWFDTDNQNVTINHATLVGSYNAALQLERNEGPITLENSYLCSSGAGVNLLTTEALTANNNVFYNNGATNQHQAQFYLAGTAGGIRIINWLTGQVYDLVTTGTVLSGNSFIDNTSGQFVFGTYLNGRDWTDFTSTLKSDNNTWFDPNTTEAFQIENGKTVNLPGWQAATGADYNSQWAAPESSPESACTPPAASYPDFNVSLDSGSYAMSSGVATATVRVNSFDFGTVNLSVSGLPSGVSPFFSTSSLVSGFSTLTLIASSTSVAQTVPVTLWAISGDRVHSATFNLTVNRNPGVISTTTALATSAPSIAENSPITLKATVQAAKGGTSPTGNVTFYNEGAALGKATLSGGVATLTTSALPVGTNSITATYIGTSTFSASTSSAVNVTVTAAAASTATTTTTLSASASNISQGSSLTLTARVNASNAGSILTGTVTFYNGTAVIGSASLSSGGVATLSTSSLPVGLDSITAVYSSANGLGSSTSTAISIQVNSTAASTTTKLATSATTVTQGSSVILTATVKPSGGTITPTGTVSFYNGSALLGSAPLSAGSASLTTSSLPVGTDSISAAYSGTVAFNASISGVVVITVNPAASAANTTTTTTLTSSATTVTQNSSITFVATVKPASGTTTPAGTVSFYNGASVIGTVQLASGTATLSTSSLPVGNSTITAAYAGTSTFNPSKSATVSVTVTAATVDTTTSISASTNSITMSSSVTFTATVKAATGANAPTGTVTFFDGATSLGTASLSSGVASVSTTALSEGQHSITAVYGGSSAFLKSTSNPVSISVVSNPAVALVSTSTAVASSASQADQGSSISLTATVTAASGTTSPTGQVVFSVGKQNIGSAPLASGAATLITSSLPVGSDEIIASYSGDNTFAASTSPAISVAISAPDFTVEAMPSTVSTTPGGSVNVTLLITPKNGFNQNPQLSCSGLPAGVSCSFGALAKQPDGTSRVTMTIETASTNAVARVADSPRAPFGLALLPLVLCISSKRRKQFRKLWSLSLFAMTIALLGSTIGCGFWPRSGATTNTSGATTTITVIAQTTTGLSHTTNVQLTMM